MNFAPTHPSNLIPFPSTTSARVTRPGMDFSISRCKIFMRTPPSHPVTSAYGVELIDAVRMSQFHSEVTFRVELRRDHLRQSLLCGLLNPSYTAGIGIAIDPVTGSVMDLVNDAAVIGYMSRSCLSTDEPLSVELRLQRFGRNLISTVAIDDDSFMYPAFLAGHQEIFQAMVGSDIDSGAVVSYRRPSLRTMSLSKAA
jgi:hypothetical protein